MCGSSCCTGCCSAAPAGPTHLWVFLAARHLHWLVRQAGPPLCIGLFCSSSGNDKGGQRASTPLEQPGGGSRWRRGGSGTPTHSLRALPRVVLSV